MQQSSDSNHQTTKHQGQMAWVVTMAALHSSIVGMSDNLYVAKDLSEGKRSLAFAPVVQHSAVPVWPCAHFPPG